jgi:hypothetical protein
MDGILMPKYDTTGMITPVLCRRCGEVYDLTRVEVTVRSPDCTLFVTPCCGVKADDREYVSAPYFRRLKPEEML